MLADVEELFLVLLSPRSAQFALAVTCVTSAVFSAPNV